MYIQDSIKDSWLDDYDFNDVRQLESARAAAEKKQMIDADDTAKGDEALTIPQLQREMVVILKPGESVSTAIRRLGNATKSLSASERLKLKKMAKKGGSANVKQCDNELERKQLARLTELSDLLIRRGMFIRT